MYELAALESDERVEIHQSISLSNPVNHNTLLTDIHSQQVLNSISTVYLLSLHDKFYTQRYPQSFPDLTSQPLWFTTISIYIFYTYLSNFILISNITVNHNGLLGMSLAIHQSITNVTRSIKMKATNLIMVLVLIGSIASMGAVLKECSSTKTAIYQAIK